MNHIIVDAAATGEEIEALIHKLEPVLEGQPIHHVIITLLSMIIVTMKGDITTEELGMAVRDSSRYICGILDPARDEDNPAPIMVPGSKTIN